MEKFIKFLYQILMKEYINVIVWITQEILYKYNRLIHLEFKKLFNNRTDKNFNFSALLSIYF